MFDFKVSGKQSQPKGETRQYDLIVVGGGAAGLTCAIYTSRDSIKTLVLEKEATAEQINAAVKKAAATPGLAHALEYTEDPIVSVDIVGNPHGSIFDSQMTMAEGKFAKVFSWYDNEWGFSNRMVDMMRIML